MAETVSITTISPGVIAANTGVDVTLTITGAGFVAGATVYWNTTALNSSYISATQVSAVVPASLTTLPVQVFITVKNPDGTLSNNRLPSGAISDVSPDVHCRGLGFRLSGLRIRGGLAGG